MTVAHRLYLSDGCFCTGALALTRILLNRAFSLGGRVTVGILYTLYISTCENECRCVRQRLSRFLPPCSLSLRSARFSARVRLTNPALTWWQKSPLWAQNGRCGASPPGQAAWLLAASRTAGGASFVGQPFFLLWILIRISIYLFIYLLLIYLFVLPLPILYFLWLVLWCLSG